MASARRRHRERLFVASVLLFAAAVSARARTDAYRWSLDETRDGIELYTSDSSLDDSYDAVKAVTVIDARPDRLVAILRDISSFPRWYSRCKETRVLERPAATLPVRVAEDGKFVPGDGQESYVLFFLQALPVVSDRWAILRNSLRFGRDGSLTIEFHSLDRYAYPAPAGATRMRISGAWTLTPLSAARTRVALTLDIDPALSTPAFLVDPKLHDIAVETVAGLRKLSTGRAARSPL